MKTDTIKAMIVKKIWQQSCGTLQQEDLSDENVRKELEKYIRKVCYSLPGEDDPDKNPEGAEFAAIMFRTHKDLHAATVNKIVGMIMEERDDLVDFKHLRKKIVEAMTRDWHDLCGGLINTEVIKNVAER